MNVFSFYFYYGCSCLPLLSEMLLVPVDFHWECSFWVFVSNETAFLWWSFAAGIILYLYVCLHCSSNGCLAGITNTGTFNTSGQWSKWSGRVPIQKLDLLTQWDSPPCYTASGCITRSSAVNYPHSGTNAQIQQHTSLGGYTCILWLLRHLLINSVG